MLMCMCSFFTATVQAEILARLHHPNVCRAIGSGFHPLPFIVMEELVPMTQHVNMRGPANARLTFEQVGLPHLALSI